MDLIFIVTAMAMFITLMCILLMFAFLLGAKTAQKVDKGEKIELPSINPMEIYRRYEEQQESKEKQEELETNMHNINNYVGDSTGQKDFN